MAKFLPSLWPCFLSLRVAYRQKFFKPLPLNGDVIHVKPFRKSIPIGLYDKSRRIKFVNPSNHSLLRNWRWFSDKIRVCRLAIFPNTLLSKSDKLLWLKSRTSRNGKSSNEFGSTFSIRFLEKSIARIDETFDQIFSRSNFLSLVNWFRDRMMLHVSSGTKKCSFSSWKYNYETLLQECNYRTRKYSSFKGKTGWNDKGFRF